MAHSILETKGAERFKKQLDGLKAQRGLLILGFRSSLGTSHTWIRKEASLCAHTFLCTSPA